MDKSLEAKWKEFELNRKSSKAKTTHLTNNLCFHNDRTVSVTCEKEILEMIQYTINTYSVWSIDTVRSRFNFKELLSPDYSSHWAHIRKEFYDMFSQADYSLGTLTKKLRKSNLEKSILFLKLPNDNFNIVLADLLVNIFNRKLKLTVHETVNFATSQPLTEVLIDANFFEHERRGVLDIRLNIHECQKGLKNFKRHFDKLFKKVGANYYLEVLLKTRNYVTQWHFDSEVTPSVVVFRQLVGESLFLGLPSVYGFYFLAKSQLGILKLEDVVAHFKKAKGKVKGENVLRGKKKENVLVKQGETILVFPNCMHQVHVPFNCPKSIAVALVYELHDLRKETRNEGYFYNYETKKRKR